MYEARTKTHTQPKHPTHSNYVVWLLGGDSLRLDVRHGLLLYTMVV